VVAKSMPATQPAWSLPRLVIADGTLEALKWLALVLMVLDHTNKVLFEGKIPFVFEAARIAMPLFGFVLGYNLARSGTLSTACWSRHVSASPAAACTEMPRQRPTKRIAHLI